MSKVEKYLRQKESELPSEVRLHKKRVDMIHTLLFSEEYSFMFDSSVDFKSRETGRSPMNCTYIEQINAKRKSFGIAPLGENGIPQDESSKEFCRKIITELESIKN